jgi:hypothetical protein
MSDSEYSETSDVEEDNYETSSVNNSNNKVYHTKNGKRVPLGENEVPEVLKEPVLFEPKKKNKDEEEQKYNFNKPKDQMVLIEDKPISELQEAEDMLAKYSDDPFSQFEKPKKKVETLNLSGWELKYSDIFKTINNKVDAVIPIINFSTIYDIDNIAKLSTLCNTFRKLNKNTILTFCGGLLEKGQFYETSFKGRHLIHLFNQLKVDFMTLSEQDLANDQLTSRISDFKGTVILSNVEEKNNKIPGTFKYVIRKVIDKSNFENKICFLGLSESEIYDTLNPKEITSSIMETKKVDISVALSALNFDDNLQIKANLILGKSNKYNLSSFAEKTKIITSDPNLNSVSVSIIQFPKGSREYTLQTHIISLIDIPEDINFSVHQNYWKDLGYDELRNKYKFDFSKIFKNPILKSKAFLKFIIEALSKFKDIGYVILDPNVFAELGANIKTIDLFKLFPEEHKLVKFKITEPELLYKIMNDGRIKYSKVNDSNIIITTQNVAESIISEYIFDFDVQIVGDIKTLIYENL